jgi:hypothetical protein
MPKLPRQKITLAEMRASGVRGLLIYCSDFRCSHWTAVSGDRWPDDVRLSDLEPRFTCQACGRRGVDVWPNFAWEREAVRATAGVMRALNRHVERELNPSRKDHHWGRWRGIANFFFTRCGDTCRAPRSPHGSGLAYFGLL